MGTLGGMPLELQVGDRVQSRDDHRATVMYVGSVAGATPEEGWVGLQVRVLRFLRVWSHAHRAWQPSSVYTRAPACDYPCTCADPCADPCAGPRVCLRSCSGTWSGAASTTAS